MHEMLTFRLAQLNDCELFFRWANDAAVRQNSFSPEPISWEAHCQWFEKKLHSNESFLFVFYSGKDAVGQLRLDTIDNRTAEIDFSIDDNWRGKGLGKCMLQTAKTFLHKLRGNLVLRGIVMRGNVPSVKAFEGAGFQNRGTANFQTYECLIFYSV